MSVKAGDRVTVLGDAATGTVRRTRVLANGRVEAIVDVDGAQGIAANGVGVYADDLIVIGVFASRAHKHKHGRRCVACAEQAPELVPCWNCGTWACDGCEG